MAWDDPALIPTHVQNHTLCLVDLSSAGWNMYWKANWWGQIINHVFKITVIATKAPAKKKNLPFTCFSYRHLANRCGSPGSVWSDRATKCIFQSVQGQICRVSEITFISSKNLVIQRLGTGEGKCPCGLCACMLSVCCTSCSIYIPIHCMHVFGKSSKVIYDKKKGSDFSSLWEPSQ